MKLVHDSSALPTTDPWTWQDMVRRDRPEEERWDFNATHFPWEFPYVSELAKKCRATYGELDRDSDSLLEAVLAPLWAKDLVERYEGEVAVELQELAEKLVQVEKRIAEEDKAYREGFAYLEKLREERKELPEEEDSEEDSSTKILDDLLGRQPSAISKLARRHVENRQVWEDERAEICRKFLYALVGSGYEATLEGTSDWIRYWKANSLKKYEELGVEYFRKQTINSEGSYLYHVMAYPSENLPYYFYDELVFAAGVQTTVVDSTTEGEWGFIRTFEERDKTEWFKAYLDGGGHYHWWT